MKSLQPKNGDWMAAKRRKNRKRKTPIHERFESLGNDWEPMDSKRYKDEKPVFMSLTRWLMSPGAANGWFFVPFALFWLSQRRWRL